MGHLPLLFSYRLQAFMSLLLFLFAGFYSGQCIATLTSPFSAASVQRGHIKCSGRLPSVRYADGLSTRVFRTPQRLCALGETEDGRRNMACSCLSPNSQPECHEAEADPDLFHQQAIRDFCHKRCVCTNSLPERQRMTRIDEEVAVGEAAMNYLVGGGNGELADFESLIGLASSSSQPICNGPCQWIESCLAAIPGGCACTYRQGRRTPGGCECEVRQSHESDRLWFGSCRKSRDKRDLEVSSNPCACNNSYISMGCCASSNGIVQEGPEMNMGSLVLS